MRVDRHPDELELDVRRRRHRRPRGTPAHTYAAAGAYAVALTATNALRLGHVETKAGYITVTSGGTGTWQTIAYDSFESNLGSYTDGGSDMSRYTGSTYSYGARASADIRTTAEPRRRSTTPRHTTCRRMSTCRSTSAR